MSWTQCGWDDYKMPKEELYQILKKIVWYETWENSATWKTSIFKWIDSTMLLNKLINYDIGIIEVDEWKIIIPEWKWNCDYFFLLLKWTIGIYKKDIWITNIDTVNVIWEIWFLTKSERTATAKAKEKCYLLPLDQVFIDSLPFEVQVNIYKNLAIEIWKKLDYMNNNNFKLWLSWSLWKDPEPSDVTNNVKVIVEQLII